MIIKQLINLWRWFGEQRNHNVITVIIGIAALFFAFPYFSQQINEVEIQVDSLELSIKELYSRKKVEAFPHDQVKNFDIISIEEKKYLKIPLQSLPIKNSASLWFGGVFQPPQWYLTEGNFIFMKLNPDLGYEKSIDVFATYPDTDNFVVVVYTSQE